MRNFCHVLPVIASACFLAADDIGSGVASSAPPSGPLDYRRKSDSSTVRAQRYIELGRFTVGMHLDEGSAEKEYVITSTGDKETVNLGDYVVRETDYEHYFAYPADKFEAEFELLPAAVPPVPADRETNPPQRQDEAVPEVSGPQSAGEVAYNVHVSGESDPPAFRDLPADEQADWDLIAEAVLDFDDNMTQDPAKRLVGPGFHTPSTPDAPTASEGAQALGVLLGYFPKLHAGLLEVPRYALPDQRFTEVDRAAIRKALRVIETRYK